MAREALTHERQRRDVEATLAALGDSPNPSKLRRALMGIWDRGWYAGWNEAETSRGPNDPAAVEDIAPIEKEIAQWNIEEDP